MNFRSFDKGFPMKKFTPFLVALLVLLPAVGSGQVNNEFVPYLSSGYTYQFVNKSSSLVGTFYRTMAKPARVGRRHRARSAR